MSTGTETTIASIANKVAYGGGGLAVVGGLGGADIITAASGLLIGALGFGVTLYYRRKADARAAAAAAAVERREAEEHTARMALYARGIDPHGQ